MIIETLEKAKSLQKEIELREKERDAMKKAYYAYKSVEISDCFILEDVSRKMWDIGMKEYGTMIWKLKKELEDL